MPELVFQLHSWWHSGTGQGAGAHADAVIQRDPDGLPYLPGRTVKGLVREALSRGASIDLISTAQRDQLLGSDFRDGQGGWNPSDRIPQRTDSDAAARMLTEARYSTEQGLLQFTNATLPDSWSTWAQGADAASLGRLGQLLASTSIDKDGVASDHTLRTIEVAPPMTLRSQLTLRVSAKGDASESTWADTLRRCLPLVRSLGSHRNRGLGRVTISLEGA